jgi:hypothetical protein
MLLKHVTDALIPYPAQVSNVLTTGSLQDGRWHASAVCFLPCLPCHDVLREWSNSHLPGIWQSFLDVSLCSF